MDFAVPADHQMKIKKIKKIDKYLDVAKDLKKMLNSKVTMILIIHGALGKAIGGIGSQKKNGDHPNNRTFKIS